jgi:hypothetical protein
MRPSGYWTLENCKIDALNFTTRLEWQKKSNSSYSKAVRMGWLEMCCEHMLKHKKVAI